MSRDIRFGIGSMVVGVGVEVVATILPQLWDNPPKWVLGLIAGIGAILILVGLFIVIQSLLSKDDDDMPGGNGPKAGGDQYKIKDSVVSFDQKGGITAKEVKVQHGTLEEGGDHARQEGQ